MILSVFTFFYQLFVILWPQLAEHTSTYGIAIVSCVYGLIILLSYSFSISYDQQLEKKLPKIEINNYANHKSSPESNFEDNNDDEQLMTMNNLLSHQQTEIYIHQLEPIFMGDNITTEL